MMLGYIDVADLPAELQPLLMASMWINLVALVARYLIRIDACHKVYGTSDWVGVSLRWPVSLYINMAASWRAWKTYLGESALATKPIVWSKTTHELPDDFMAATR